MSGLFSMRSNDVQDKLDGLKSQIADVKNDVSDIKSDISDIKVIMGINTESLKIHIKRTDDLQIMAEEFKKFTLIVNTSFKVIIAVGSVLLFLDQFGLLKKLM